MRKLIASIIILLLCLLPLSGWALNEQTHQDINEFIGDRTTELNGFSLDKYIKEQLGFTQGKEKKFVKNFESKEVYKWLGEGGFREDKPKGKTPYLRSANHFHNPLQPLAQAGFSGLLNSPYLVPGESSIAWSQRDKGTQHIGGHYSWHDARDYFYKALTTEVNGMRDVYFAETFRALGQLMHLIEDLSVPEHARDDGHYAAAYEDYVKKMIEKDILHPETYLSKFTPIFFNKTALAQASPFAQASVPVARMFDSNQYTGANPIITLRQDIGLSEYTNANFVSGNTLINGGRFNTNFPFPAMSSVREEVRDIPDPLHAGLTVKRPYYYKEADGETGYLLAGVGYFEFYLDQEHIEVPPDRLPPMDEHVFKDYAAKLLPRAIGYASGLLDYFFRGKLEVVGLPMFTNRAGQRKMFINAKNITPGGESMTEGRFSLVMEYPNPDYDANNPDSAEKLYARGYFDEALTIPEVNIAQLESGQSALMEFYFPLTFDLPDNLDDIHYFLAYKGGLGSEENEAVIGKYFHPETQTTATFAEEWNSLGGNYAWRHYGTWDTTTNPNFVSSGPPTVLVKENIRPANQSYGGEENITDLKLYTTPISVTPNTYVQFKIDKMTINQQPPDINGHTSAWSGFYIEFENATKGIGVFLTFPGQEAYVTGGGISVEYFQRGEIWQKNLYDLVYDKFDSPFSVVRMEFIQTISYYQQSAVEYKQDMEVDFVRLLESVPQ